MTSGKHLELESVEHLLPLSYSILATVEGPRTYWEHVTCTVEAGREYRKTYMYWVSIGENKTHSDRQADGQTNQS